jgi:hypothetical protein
VSILVYRAAATLRPIPCSVLGEPSLRAWVAWVTIGGMRAVNRSHDVYRLANPHATKSARSASGQSLSGNVVTSAPLQVPVGNSREVSTPSFRTVELGDLARRGHRRMRPEYGPDDKIETPGGDKTRGRRGRRRRGRLTRRCAGLNRSPHENR